MFDIDDLMNRAKRASDAASENLEKSIRKSQEIVRQMTEEKEEQKQQGDDGQRQVEIMGQVLGADGLQQATAMEEQIRAEVEQQVTAYAAMNADEMLGKLLGDDMGIIAAALETLAEEDSDGESPDDDLTVEQLCGLLKAKMALVEALPEPPTAPYGDSIGQWQRFGILLSGIISRLNRHELSSLDVEEHIPVMEQQIASLVRNSWGIRGREGLLDTLRYLTQEGYRLRYRSYAMAAAPEELFEPDMDEDEQAGVRGGWTFVQSFKQAVPADFLLGWDIGRAAMLTRWGYYLGWITQGEAVGILSDLSQAAVQGLGGWREFGRSYQFGGVFWKILCGAGDGGSYLCSLTDAITELLTDSGTDDDGGQWRACPWPSRERDTCQ